jgi:hypothetical protein
LDNVSLKKQKTIRAISILLGAIITWTLNKNYIFAFIKFISWTPLCMFFFLAHTGSFDANIFKILLIVFLTILNTTITLKLKKITKTNLLLILTLGVFNILVVGSIILMSETL